MNPHELANCDVSQTVNFLIQFKFHNPVRVRTHFKCVYLWTGMPDSPQIFTAYPLKCMLSFDTGIKTKFEISILSTLMLDTSIVYSFWFLKLLFCSRHHLECFL